MNQKIYPKYSTQDIILSAVLKVEDYQLDEIELMGNKGIFHFLDVDAQILSDYDCGKILVEPVEFNNALKNLTTAVRSQKQRG
jgi:hypothetical protein